MSFRRIERALFKRRETERRLWTPLREVAQIAWLIGHDIFEGRIALYAMGLVYSTLFAIVPLLAFAVVALKGLGVHGALASGLHRLLVPLGPGGDIIAADLLGFVDKINVGVLGVLGVVMLAYSSFMLLLMLEAGLNESWKVPGSNPLIARGVKYLSLLIFGPVFLLAAFGVTAALTNDSVINHLIIIGPLLAAFAKILPYLIAISAFTLINLITPNTRVKFRAALAAGIAGGVAWQIVGQLFSLLAASSTRLSAIYSSFAILVLFLSWLYLSWLILLLGGRLGFYVQNSAWRRPAAERRPLAPANTEAAALDIMLAAAECFSAGGQPLDFGEYVGRIGVPGPQLAPVLDHLVAAELLFRLRGSRYAIARSSAKITVAEVIEAARGEVPVWAEPGWLGELLGKANTARVATLGQTTLADLAARGTESKTSEQDGAPCST
ncbi:MAG: YhjD/YihY/BrkB family envelope integrity protein [Gammaproteobacteria bacterium]